jgi:hypothetical protein
MHVKLSIIVSLSAMNTSIYFSFYCNFHYVPAIATEMFILFYYNLLPQLVSALTGYPQAKHIIYLFMVPHRIRCFVIV